MFLISGNTYMDSALCHGLQVNLSLANGPSFWLDAVLKGTPNYSNILEDIAA